MTRDELQLLVVRHAEDISWSDAFAAVRTVYEKPGPVLVTLPPTPRPAAAAAPHAARVVLPNVGREQHAYLTHIVRNYDSLAERTVLTRARTQTRSLTRTRTLTPTPTLTLTPTPTLTLP